MKTYLESLKATQTALEHDNAQLRAERDALRRTLARYEQLHRAINAQVRLRGMMSVTDAVLEAHNAIVRGDDLPTAPECAADAQAFSDAHDPNVG